LNLKDGTDKYEVRTKNGEAQTVKFDEKVKDGGTAEGQVELEFKKESEKLKEELPQAGVGFFKSRRWPFWAVVAVVESDLDTFLQKNHDKLVLVKFSTAWCPPCQVLQKNIGELLAELEKSAAPKKELLVLEVDAEKFPQLAQRTQFRPVGKVINTSPFHGEDRGFESRTGHQIGGRLSVIFVETRRRINAGSIPVASARFAGPHRAIGRRSGLKIRPVWVRLPLWAPLEGFIYQYIDTAEGKVNFNTTPKSNLELKILDNNDKEVKEYDYILPTDSKANRSLFDQEIKKIHKKLLKENQSDLFSLDEKKSLPDSDDILYNITETEGKIQLNFYKKDATATSSKVLLEDQIKIEPKYYVTSEITFSEGGDLTEEKNSKPKLTTG
ncbi:16925_t:CDS:2, partial [Cetraspora pellucida]